MAKVYTLSTGVEIEQSDRKSNRSGYTGAALSPAWTLDTKRPFIAACSNPTDPTVMAQMRAQNRTAWHGGCYADAREAAYVVGMFRNDPVGMDQLIGEQGAFEDFPADLYDLPVVTTADEACGYIAESKNKAIKTTAAKATKVKKLTSVAAKEVFWKIYNRNTMQDLIARFGRNTVEDSFKVLTISEFEARFGLEAA